MKNIIHYIFIFIFIPLVLTVTSCRRDTDDYIITKEINKGTIINIDIAGYVSDVNGNPIADANVRIGNYTAVSDDLGLYFFDQVAVYNKIETIHVSADGYTDRVTTERFESSSFYNRNIKMNSLADKVSFNSTDTVVRLKDDFILKPSSTSFLTASDEIYNGNIFIYYEWIPTIDEKTTEFIPGDFRIYNTESELGIMQMESAIRLDFRGSRDEKLKINSEAEPILTMEYKDPLTSEMMLWSYDTKVGLWIDEEDIENYSSEIQSMSINSSGWHAIGTFHESIDFSFKIVDSEDRPRRHFANIIKNNNTPIGIYNSNGSGLSYATLPKNKKVLLHISDQCQNTSFDQLIIENLYDNTYYGQIQVNTDQNDQEVSGTLYNCDNEEVIDGYILYNNVIYDVTSDGRFTITIRTCDMEIPFIAYDRKTDERIEKNLAEIINASDIKIKVCQ